ncbi:hypothetical protein [Microlunatus sp. Gsoil 973]|uniref:hypothetical protein n=1 Tax=Microlunatus sp. Gsoil 973 TaxID=2672569 RepID=UPI0012B447C4|nr:hypothetical protein [Microlunatus sp. Gsoil 973]QGN33040.1 hypothetical protein GJV80_09700 [Microlunatus sp. Gsoil 973]
MSEISGFDWWFRDRDSVLRENLEALEAGGAAAASGYREEKELLSSAHQLRTTIEHPDGNPTPVDDAQPDRRLPVIEAVRSAHARLQPSPARTAICAAIMPSLRQRAVGSTDSPVPQPAARSSCW